MDARKAGTGLPLVGAVVAGATVSHTLVYWVVVPDTGVRATVLARSGHGYWPVAVAAAIVFGLLAAGTTVVRHFNRGLGRATGRLDVAGPERYDQLACRVAALQAATYVVHEVLERLVAGVPLAELPHLSDLLLTGVAVQVVVAFGVAAVLVLLGRAAEAVGRKLGRAFGARPGQAPTRAPPATPRRSRRPNGPAAIRAPPAEVCA